jgi:hypothetical protein
MNLTTSNVTRTTDVQTELHRTVEFLIIYENFNFFMVIMPEFPVLKGKGIGTIHRVLKRNARHFLIYWTWMFLLSDFYLPGLYSRTIPTLCNNHESCQTGALFLWKEAPKPRSQPVTASYRYRHQHAPCTLRSEEAENVQRTTAQRTLQRRKPRQSLRIS